MNGAPANPMSGVPPSSPTRALAASVMLATSSGSRSRSWSSWSRRRIGSATTGPVPGTMSRSTPTALSGTTMSEKKIAASTPYRRTGCMVISTTRSVRKHDSSIGTPSRMARYSGSERPAWRMNQTGHVVGGLAAAGAQEGAVGEGHGVDCVRAHVCAGARVCRYPHDRRHAYDHRVGVRSEIDRTPPAFTAAVEQVGRAVLRPEVVVDTMPAPQRIAPFAHAVSGDVITPGTARPGPATATTRSAPGGSSCCTTRPATTPGAARSAASRSPAPTSSPRWPPTRPCPPSAGAGSPTPSTPTAASTSPRAAASPSCTPKDSARWPPTAPTPRSRSAPPGRRRRDMGAHISAWSDLLCAIAGLPPLAPGVIPLQQRRRGTR